jgi:hypothetical protein
MALATAQHDRVAGRNPAVFGKLPNCVIRNPEVDAGVLVILAYRSTFGDDERDYGLNPAVLKRIVKSGLGRDCSERAIVKAQKLGYPSRSQPAPSRRAGKFYSKFAIDTLTLPPIGEDRFLLIERSVFDGSLTASELAALLYIRAGAGKGAGVYRREIEERFGWSDYLSGKVLNTLRERQLISRTSSRVDGRFAGTTYSAHRCPQNQVAVTGDHDEIARAPVTRAPQGRAHTEDPPHGGSPARNIRLDGATAFRPSVGNAAAVPAASPVDRHQQNLADLPEWARGDAPTVTSPAATDPWEDNALLGWLTSGEFGEHAERADMTEPEDGTLGEVYDACPDDEELRNLILSATKKRPRSACRRSS